MEKVARYKSIVREIMAEIQRIRTENRYPVPTQIVVDEEHGQYLMYKNGWQGERRIYGCFLHIEVTPEAKVWLHHDGTDLVIGQILLDKGVAKKDLVLGFHAPVMRKDTEFAVA